MEMTKQQRRMLSIVRECILEDRGRTGSTDVKEERVEPSGVRGRVLLHFVVGLPGDDGTAAAIYCRDRYFVCIGPRGAARSYDGKRWVPFRSWITMKLR